MSDVWKSSNHLISHTYKHLFTPDSQEEILSAIKCSRNIRVVGSGQSSADIAAGTGSLISLKKYDRILSIDIKRREITVQAGITLSNLLQEIDRLGWSLPALPDIDTITLGGAISTGTHGTGNQAHSLSEYMTACTLLSAEGEVITVDSSSSYFDAARVSLGLLGIMSTITLRCVPKFLLEVVEKPVKDEVWLHTYVNDVKKNFFYRVLWLPHSGYGYVITGKKSKKMSLSEIEAPSHVKHRRKVSLQLYSLTGRYPFLTPIANKILQKVFFSHRKVHFGSLYETTVTKSRGAPIELAEWSIPIENFNDCFKELRCDLNSQKNGSYAHIPMDIRFLRKDSSWLSNAYERNIVTVGCVTRTPELADKYKAFTTVENIFRKYGGRPHWAKRHTMNAKDLRKAYPKWDDFIGLRRRSDQNGKFLNEYLKKIFE